MATGRIEEFATADQILEYNKASGNPNAETTITVGGVTDKRFTAEEVKTANFRANKHARIQYFNDLEDKWKLNKDGSGNIATTLDELFDEVRCAFQEAVSIMAALELLSPNFFSSSVNLATDIQVKKLDVIEFFEQKHASVETQVDATRGRSGEVLQLLNPYTKTDLLKPAATSSAATNDSSSCPSGGLLGIGITF